MGQMVISVEPLESASQDWLVHLATRRRLSRAEYRAFAQANPDLRIERTSGGEVIVMPPVHSRTGSRNMEIARQFANWAVTDGTGVAFDSSAGFDLPNGSNRSPDVSWVRNSRIETLTPEQTQDYYPLCPDFIIELRSTSDRLSQIEEKMREYIDNGAMLGWLIDPVERCVRIYRPGTSVVVIEEPASVSGDPELPGFVLDLTNIWR